MLVKSKSHQVLPAKTFYQVYDHKRKTKMQSIQDQQVFEHVKEHLKGFAHAKSGVSQERTRFVSDLFSESQFQMQVLQLSKPSSTSVVKNLKRTLELQVSQGKPKNLNTGYYQNKFIPLLKNHSLQEKVSKQQKQAQRTPTQTPQKLLASKQMSSVSSFQAFEDSAHMKNVIQEYQKKRMGTAQGSFVKPQLSEKAKPLISSFKKVASQEKISRNILLTENHTSAHSIIDLQKSQSSSYPKQRLLSSKLRQTLDSLKSEKQTRNKIFQTYLQSSQISEVARQSYLNQVKTQQELMQKIKKLKKPQFNQTVGLIANKSSPVKSIKNSTFSQMNTFKVPKKSGSVISSQAETSIDQPVAPLVEFRLKPSLGGENLKIEDQFEEKKHARVTFQVKKPETLVTEEMDQVSDLSPVSQIRLPLKPQKSDPLQNDFTSNFERLKNVSSQNQFDRKTTLLSPSSKQGPKSPQYQQVRGKSLFKSKTIALDNTLSSGSPKKSQVKSIDSAEDDEQKLQEEVLNMFQNKYYANNFKGAENVKKFKLKELVTDLKEGFQTQQKQKKKIAEEIKKMVALLEQNK